MGAYSPAPVVTPEIHARVMREVIQPTLAGMAQQGLPYTGFLYAGLMIDRGGGIKVLEYNCRMGVEWDRRCALGVVMAAAGYPENPRKGDAISGLPRAADDVHVFHAATAERDGQVVVSGGRVLCVTALGDTVKIAQRQAYEACDRIRFDGMQYRRDIGHRALAPRRT
ncbi:MAG: phosphoribosylamine--glycine ligase [Proteobacteria bacterium]|nr:phosphoribosylamine--glycine ligase [Pseudomonadota bacterium]